MIFGLKKMINNNLFSSKNTHLNFYIIELPVLIHKVSAAGTATMPAIHPAGAAG